MTRRPSLSSTPVSAFLTTPVLLLLLGAGCAANFRYDSTSRIPDPLHVPHTLTVNVSEKSIPGKLRNDRNIAQIKEAIASDLTTNVFGRRPTPGGAPMQAVVDLDVLRYSEVPWGLLILPLTYVGAPLGTVRASTSVRLTLVSDAGTTLASYESSHEMAGYFGLYYGYNLALESKDGGLASSVVKQAMDDIKAQVQSDRTRLTSVLSMDNQRHIPLADGRSYTHSQEGVQEDSRWRRFHVAGDDEDAGLVTSPASDGQRWPDEPETQGKPNQATHTEGSQRLSLGGSFTSTYSYAENSRLVSAIANLEGRFSYGYFVNSGIELGLSGYGGATQSLLKSDANSTMMSYAGADGYLKYYFVSDSEHIPYIGGRVGTVGAYSPVTKCFSLTSITFGGVAGVEFMMSDAASAFGEYSGTWGSSGPFEKSTGLWWTWTNQFLVGLAFFF